MSTTWSHNSVPNGATSPRSAAQTREGLEVTSRAFAGSVGASVAAEVVEHPMTPEDVAVLLRIDRETVYRMARRGQLPAFKVSSRWRFLPSHLQRWMEDQEGTSR